MLAQVVVENVPVRRGLLLLQPTNIAVLGGAVEALEEARCRAVTVWNKPAGVFVTPYIVMFRCLHCM